MIKNPRPRFSFVFLLLGLLSVGASSGADKAVTTGDFDRVVLAELERQETVGVAVGVIIDNRIVYLNGYGWADREREIPVDTQTLFRWASISKPLTALAAMQLSEQGRLDIDADVRTYLPEFPDKEAKITSRQLMGHLGGIVHYSNGPVVRTKRDYDNEHPFKDVVLALDTFKESPLVYPPGEKYSYTTHGFILLSAVVQRAGGEPFDLQVQKRIADPLGMDTLQPDYQWKDIPNRARGYMRVAGVVVPSTNTDVSWKLGGGGYLSNVGDLTRLAEGLLQGKLISEETRKLMWTRQKTNSGKRIGYGMGFNVSGEGSDLKVSHGGSQEKVKTRMEIHPGKGTGVVVMCNARHANPTKFSELIFELIEPGKEEK